MRLESTNLLNTIQGSKKTPLAIGSDNEQPEIMRTEGDENYKI
jgi:hypothetical protein